MYDRKATCHTAACSNLAVAHGAGLMLMLRQDEFIRNVVHITHILQSQWFVSMAGDLRFNLQLDLQNVEFNISNTSHKWLKSNLWVASHDITPRTNLCKHPFHPTCLDKPISSVFISHKAPDGTVWRHQQPLAERVGVCQHWPPPLEMHIRGCFASAAPAPTDGWCDSV